MDLLSSAAQQQAVVGDAVSETQHVLSKEDFLKLMLPDSPSVEEGRRKVSDFCVALKLPETLRKRLKRRQDSQGHFHTVIPPGSGVRLREVRKGDFWMDRGSSKQTGMASPLSCEDSRPCGVSFFIFVFPFHHVILYIGSVICFFIF